MAKLNVYNVKCPKCKAEERMRCTEPGKLRRFRVVVAPHKERFDKLNDQT